MANDNKGLTPMMRQFFEMKSKHPEALLAAYRANRADSVHCILKIIL